MRFEAERLALQLENPFTLSYGTTTLRENVLVRLTCGHLTGVGEAAVVPYYGETPQRVLGYLEDPALGESLGENPLWLEDALDRLPTSASTSARAAADVALHDLWGQQLGQPLYRLWGLNPDRSPRSSFTVAMADDDTTYRERVRAACDYGVVKVKLGSGDWRRDLRLAEIAQEEANGRLCVDANAGWTVEETLAISPALTAMDVQFVEQPVARHDLAGWQALRERLPAQHTPLIADESVQGVESVARLAGLVDGINVKLAKCGGLRPARQMIALARAYGMQVLIGCMVESSVGVTAAAHLAPLADYADLDGNLLITNDPYRGVRLEQGRIILPHAPGLGVTRAE